MARGKNGKKSKSGGTQKNKSKHVPVNNDPGKGKNQLSHEEFESSSSNGDSKEKTNTFVVPKPNTLIIGNLSEIVGDNDLSLFFIKSGIAPPEIGEIRVDTFEDGMTCRGSAQVEFTTAQAVQEACKLNGTKLHGQAITINFGHERSTISSDSSSLHKPHNFSANTVLVKGFDAAYDVHKICLLLENHFGACAITNEEMVTDPETGASTGYMFMEFADQHSVSTALQLNGSDFVGCQLHVENALP